MDSLTGTLNRDAFFDRAGEELNLAARRNEKICLAMIDVDHFKQINDQNGHIVGDFVLRHISDYLINRLRRSDIVGRYAGDEFLVFLPDTDLDSASAVLDIIRKNLVAQQIQVNDTHVEVSISLGLVATQLSKPIDVESLIIEADKKLYEAKVAGRNTLVSGEI
jgi:diguanylate cyclase (GGDEF)-like protein